VRLELTNGSAIRVGVAGYGALSAVGTAAAPVVFTTDPPDAQPGYWSGLHLGPLADAGTRLEHVVIENAGAGGWWLSGALTMDVDPGGVLRSSVIRRSGSCGVALSAEYPWRTDYAAPELGNSFQDNAGPPTCHTLRPGSPPAAVAGGRDGR
jgi:hypothetical protein